MRYHYFYQTARNESVDAWIVARDRNDAYAQLRRKGIRPYRLLGRDPIAWKRWAAIGVLAATAATLAALRLADGTRAATEEPRSQLYGDPAVVRRLSADGWRRAFADGGDAWLARHAIPAAACDCAGAAGRAGRGRDGGGAGPRATGATPGVAVLPVASADPPELAKMKRMVNGMKRELSAYLGGGGTVEDYMLLCDERLATERGLVESYRRDFGRLRGKGGDIGDAWERKNAELRSMGLPTVPLPDDAAD